MSYVQHKCSDEVNLHAINEINLGYISYHTLLEFIEAVESPSVTKMRWLELNLIAIERFIKKGKVFEIQSEYDTRIFRAKNDFYQWCKDTLNYAYILFLRDRHY